MLAGAKPTAHQPYIAILVASLQLGATAIRSRATSQMHTYGSKAQQLRGAESAMPKYVRNFTVAGICKQLADTAAFLFDSFAMRFLSNG